MQWITETMLLDGYDGITNGLDIISYINGERIIWQYRDDGPEDCCPVVSTPAGASYPIITLEYDRTGRIETDEANLDHPNLTKMQMNIESVIGTAIGD